MRSAPLAAAAIAVILSCSAASADAGEEFRLPRKTPFKGKAPTNFVLPDTTGRPVNLTDFKGMTILLTFWSCYTDFCFTSVNALHEFIREFGTERFVVATVCSEVPSALAADGYSGLLKYCSAGQVVLVDKEQLMPEIYNLDTLPVGFLIGPDFIVQEVVRKAGRLNEPEFSRKIGRLVKETGAETPP